MPTKKKRAPAKKPETAKARIERLERELSETRKALLMKNLFGTDLPPPPYSETEKDEDGLPRLDYPKVFVRMGEIVANYYRHAARLGVHSFIEHNGLMHEHMKLLQSALQAGLPPERLSVHGAKKYPMLPSQAEYLAEKFSCIFTPFFDRASLEAFTEKLWRQVGMKYPPNGYEGIPAAKEYAEYAAKVEGARARARAPLPVRPETYPPR